MSATEYLLLFFGGLLSGIINTLAGNGSAITLSLLIFIGLPPHVANATNRIGVLIQTFTSIVSLKRTPRTLMMFKDSMWFLPPAILGSIIGAFFAIETSGELLRYIIGGIMLVLLATIVTKPSKWSRPTDRGQSRKKWYNWVLIFLVAAYGGFIQMGIGIMLLAVLVLAAKYSLRDANIIKLMLAFIFIVPAFVIFYLSGDMVWRPGLVLAAGQALGAVVGARYILFLPKANDYVRWLLIVILSVSSVMLLKIPQMVISLFE